VSYTTLAGKGEEEVKAVKLSEKWRERESRKSPFFLLLFLPSSQTGIRLKRTKNSSS
jgi:hypothetical protein